ICRLFAFAIGNSIFMQVYIQYDKTKISCEERIFTVITVDRTFFRKRWLDFRNGHGIYLAFVLTFVNFILITYNFAVEKVDFLKNLLGHNLIVFTVFFIALYVPAAMLIGYWHRRHQFSVENETMLAENWIWAWITRYQIMLIQGKT